MTLAKYGIKYATWTKSDLFEFAAQRGLKVGHGNSCRQIIIALRAKDKRARLSFFDFPPEIRNMTYVILLGPEDTKLPPDFKAICHPASLFSCKQVHAEATNMLYSLFPVPLTIRSMWRNVLTDGTTPSRREYGTNAFANGKRIATGEQRKPVLRCQWPSYLSKLRSISLSVLVLDAAFDDIRYPGQEQANLSFFQLYRSLEKSTKLHELHMKIDIDCDTVIDRQYAMLSPLLTLCSQVTTSNLELDHKSDELKTIVENARLGMRSVQILKGEVKALAEVIELDILRLRHGRSTDHSSTVVVGLRKALEECEMALAVRRIHDLYAFADDVQLAESISVIEKCLYGLYQELLELYTGETKQKIEEVFTKRSKGETEMG